VDRRDQERQLGGLLVENNWKGGKSNEAGGKKLVSKGRLGFGGKDKKKSDV